MQWKSLHAQEDLNGIAQPLPELSTLTYSVKCPTINSMHEFLLPMIQFSQDDIEDFAKWLGFEGTDADTFYEAYYDIEHYDDYEAEEAEACWDP